MDVDHGRSAAARSNQAPLRHVRDRRFGASRSVTGAESASDGSGPCSARYMPPFGFTAICCPAKCIRTLHNKPGPRAGSAFRFRCTLESGSLVVVPLRRKTARLEFHRGVARACVAFMRKARSGIPVLCQGHSYAVGSGDAAGCSRQDEHHTQADETHFLHETHLRIRPR